MAKSNSSGMRKGGRLGSRVVVRPGVHNGASATGVRPGAPAQFGSAVGNHAMGVSGKLKGAAEKYATATPISVPLGNEVALNVRGGGPGTGRTVMRSGSQTGTAVTPRPIGPTKDTLAEFGPDSAGVRNRR
jgi:hypothetical protein